MDEHKAVAVSNQAPCSPPRRRVPRPRDRGMGLSERVCDVSPPVHRVCFISAHRRSGSRNWHVRIFTDLMRRRFGTDKRAPGDDLGRSMLSPNSLGLESLSLRDQPGSGNILEWTEDFQSMVFHGYTADEVSGEALNFVQPETAWKLTSSVRSS